jgi:hypothetical protein
MAIKRTKRAKQPEKRIITAEDILSFAELRGESEEDTSEALFGALYSILAFRFDEGEIERWFRERILIGQFAARAIAADRNRKKEGMH